MPATLSKRRQARVMRHKRICRRSLATSDGLRTFDYDEANRISKARIFKDGEAARISYLHNAQGQRVFKGEPTAEQTLPNEATLGQGFIDWLKANFKWMFAQAQANTSIGTAYTFGGGPIPSWAILGEYDNGAAKGAGRSEYIWLPTPDGAIPVGMYRNGNFFAIHTDHLGSPRLMTNEDNKPVWQWPYSAFGTTKPTGILKATANPRTAVVVIDETPQGRGKQQVQVDAPTSTSDTQRGLHDKEKQRAQPAAAISNPFIVMLQATAAPEFNLRFPGQYEDAETGSFYNYFRSYQQGQGRYTQNDPIGLEGGLNRFAYVEGNSLSMTDPMGLTGASHSASTGSGGSSSDGGSCTCKSFGQRTLDRYRDTSNTIDSAIDSVLPWPINSATGLAGAAGGGLAAKDYGGRTALQEAARLGGQARSSSFSLFRRIGRPDVVRVGATSLVTAVAVGVAWNGGLLVGSALSELLNGDGCD